MKRLLFSMAFPIGMAPLGLAVISAAGYAQTITSVGPVIITESSELGKKMGHDAATNGTSVVTLSTPGGPISNRRSVAGAMSRPLASGGTTMGQRYFITNLGTLGGSQSFAYALNDSGQVVGSSWTIGDATSHSFLYSNSKMTDLYPLNSQGIQTVGPTSINNAGQIASGAIVGNVYVPVVFDTATGQLTVIGSLGGVTSYGFNGVATSINNFGKAVGYSYIDSINRHAFLYANNALSDIGSCGGYSGALAINDQGVVVGFASDQYNGTAHAFKYANGTMADMNPASESYARDVNNLSQVVGEFLTADQRSFNVFLYSQGTFTDLGFAGFPYAINDQGQIVGVILLASGQHAFIYENGKPFDLNDLIPQDSGWELTWAFDINNHGQVVGYGLVNGNFRAFLSTPAVSAQQCKDGAWKNFGFKNQGQCIRFVNTGR